MTRTAEIIIINGPGFFPGRREVVMSDNQSVNNTYLYFDFIEQNGLPFRCSLKKDERLDGHKFWAQKIFSRLLKFNAGRGDGRKGTIDVSMTMFKIMCWLHLSDERACTSREASDIFRYICHEPYSDKYLREVFNNVVRDSIYVERVEGNRHLVNVQDRVALTFIEELHSKNKIHIQTGYWDTTRD